MENFFWIASKTSYVIIGSWVLAADTRLFPFFQLDLLPKSDECHGAESFFDVAASLNNELGLWYLKHTTVLQKMEYYSVGS